MVPSLIPGFHTTSLPDFDLRMAGDLIRKIGYRAVAVRLSLARLNPFADEPLKQVQVNLLREGIEGLDLVIDADPHYFFDPWSEETTGMIDGGDEGDQRLGLLFATIVMAGELGRLGAGQHTITCSVGRKPTQRDLQESLDDLAHVVSELACKAQSVGARLAVRPRAGHLVDSIGRFERLLEWVDDKTPLFLAADVGVMVAGGEMPVVDLLERVGDRLGCVYLSELKAQGVQTEPLIGSGHVSATRVVEGLRRCGFSGPVVLEPSGEERASPAEAKRWLESVFGPRIW